MAEPVFWLKTETMASNLSGNGAGVLTSGAYYGRVELYAAIDHDGGDNLFATVTVNYLSPKAIKPAGTLFTDGMAEAARVSLLGGWSASPWVFDYANRRCVMKLSRKAAPTNGTVSLKLAISGILSYIAENDTAARVTAQIGDGQATSFDILKTAPDGVIRVTDFAPVQNAATFQQHVWPGKDTPLLYYAQTGEKGAAGGVTVVRTVGADAPHELAFSDKDNMKDSRTLSEILGGHTGGAGYRLMVTANGKVTQAFDTRVYDMPAQLSFFRPDGKGRAAWGAAGADALFYNGARNDNADGYTADWAMDGPARLFIPDEDFSVYAELYPVGNLFACRTTTFFSESGLRLCRVDVYDENGEKPVAADITLKRDGHERLVPSASGFEYVLSLGESDWQG